MSDAHLEIQSDAFACTACDGRGFGFERAGIGQPFYKFPPWIGSRNPTLLFIGLNPRRSPSNLALHEWAMQDASSFSLLADNRVFDGRYIGPQGAERHYQTHCEIVARLGDRAFEEVAAVTEVFLCATRRGSRSETARVRISSWSEY